MKKNLQFTPSTAHKRSLNFDSNYKQDFSLNLFSPSNRRNPTKLSQKISSLRSTIDGLIQNISDKKTIQKGAVQKVWSVNSQLADHLSHSSYQRPLSVHSAKQQNNRLKASYKTSAFGDVSTYISPKKSVYMPQQSDQIYTQQLHLKQALNNQIRSTNQLMNQLRQLQNQHEYLRSQSHLINGGSLSNQQYQLEQNRRLKRQLQRFSSIQNNGYTMSDIWRQFRQLKDENEKLRQQTVCMLKGRSWQGGMIQNNNYNNNNYSINTNINNRNSVYNNNNTNQRQHARLASTYAY